MGNVLFPEVAGGGPALLMAEISGNVNLPSWAPATAKDMPAAYDRPAIAGAYVNPAASFTASVPGVMSGHFLFDFYYRIWIIPQVLNAQNPQYNVGIPFAVWNAYPQPYTNTLEAITATNGTGLSFNVAPPSVFKAIEYREIEITISEAAGIAVDAEFLFDFTVGQETFYFKADIADFVQMVPQVPVKETWEWLTDNLVAYDGTEQRLALRKTPRRKVNLNILLKDDAGIRRQYDRIYKNLRQPVVIPYYQYATVLTADSAIGSSALKFAPAKTDCRQDEFALVFDPVSETGYLVKLGAEAADGFATFTPLTFAAKKGWWIAPAFTSRFKDGAGIQTRAVHGTMQVECPVIVPRDVFKRPGSTATWPTLNGYPILENRDLANTENPTAFNQDVDVIDYEVGVSQQKVSWDHAHAQGKRQFFVERTDKPEQMDFWRDFLDYCTGMQNPFLHSTFREDLIPYAAPLAGDTKLRITSINYKDRYWQYESWRRIAIELQDGRILYRDVTQVDNFSDYAELTLSTAWGLNPEDLNIKKVSFLNLVRLGTDRVTWTHFHTYSVVEFEVRTVDG